jgi:hypothetical protein
VSIKRFTRYRSREAELKDLRKYKKRRKDLVRCEGTKEAAARAGLGGGRGRAA